MNQEPTTKVRAVSQDVLDEMQAAQAALQEASARLAKDPTNKDLQIVAEAARQRVMDVEDLYRKGRQSLLQFHRQHDRRQL